MPATGAVEVEEEEEDKDEARSSLPFLPEGMAVAEGGRVGRKDEWKTRGGAGKRHLAVIEDKLDSVQVAISSACFLLLLSLSLSLQQGSLQRNS